jgi:hypothetical protein
MNLQNFFFVIFRCAADGFMPRDTALALVEGKCTATNKGLIISTYIQSATSVIVDWILVLLPIPSIFKEIMDMKTRLSIIGILLLGAA